jgi:hypothetical protein
MLLNLPRIQDATVNAWAPIGANQVENDRTGLYYRLPGVLPKNETDMRDCKALAKSHHMQRNTQ